MTAQLNSPTARRGRLRDNLIAYSIFLVTIPAVVIGLFTIVQVRNSTIRQYFVQLETIASLKADAVNEWLESNDYAIDGIAFSDANTALFNQLGLAAQTGQIEPGLQSQVNALLSSYIELGQQHSENEQAGQGQATGFRIALTEFLVYTPTGEVVAASNPDEVGKVVTRQPYFQASLVAGEEGHLFHPPYTEVATGRLTMFATRPIEANGKVVLLLAGRLNLDELNDIMTERAALGTTGETYLVSSNNNYFLTPSRFGGISLNRSYSSQPIEAALRGESGQGIFPDYRGIPVLSVYSYIPELQAAYLTEIDEAEAYILFQQIAVLIAGITVLAAVASIVVAFAYANRFSRPIQQLTEAATRLAGGDLTQRSSVRANNEIGTLAGTFNQMADQLQDFIASLDARVQARTRDLATTVEVGRLATSIYNTDEMLPQLVEFIQSRFNIYYAQIYLLDDAKRFAMLRAGAGDVGRQLLARRHRLDMLETSLVSTAVRTGQPVVVPDTGLNPNHKPNALLPLTRSEVAVPLIVGQDILGVLDMQAVDPNTFNNDNAAVFQAMANQIASSLRSAEAFDEAQIAVYRSEEVNRRLNENNWGEYLGALNERGRMGYEYDLESPEWLDTGKMDAIEDPNAVMPIVIGGQEVGRIVVKDPDGRLQFGEDEQALVANVSNRLSQALEQYRAFDEVQRARQETARRADELETVAQVSAATTTLLELQDLLQAVVDLTKERFDLYHAHIYLLDQTGEYLNLAAGADAPGRMMLEHGHRIPFDREHSLVARAARERRGIIANDITEEPDFLPNPLLPDTRSELSQPLIVGDRLLGVLDMQSTEVGHFTDADVRLKAALADQIAVAIQNALAFREQQDVANRLREVDKLKSQFLANMSHELRTPLNSIIGYAEVLMDGIDGDLTEEAVEDVQAIHSGGKHLLVIINDILDLAKIEAGQMYMHRGEANLTNVLTEVHNNLTILAKNRGIDLNLDIQPGLPHVYGDPIRLKQIAYNLVNNAIKFTERGSVSIYASLKNANRVEVRIVDTGIGMTESDIASLFQQFHQVDGSPTRRAGGTGLGLVITKHLVEMHEGQIVVESEKGVGSVFSFTLPVFAVAEMEPA
jgi:signal transduction histidine kinase/HAMP domain-containing protein